MIFSYLLNMQSHPSWVCGLKPLISYVLGIIVGSHPSWVCGLKLPYTQYNDEYCGHTLRGCVD